MYISKAGVSFLTLFTLASAALANENWEKKPFLQWDEKEVRQVLENSPWAHRLKLIVARQEVERPATPTPTDAQTAAAGGSLPAGTDGSQRRPAIDPRDRPALNAARADEVAPPDETGVAGVAVVRWASARTMHEAALRRRVLRGTLTEEQARNVPLYSPHDFYVVYVDLRVSVDDVNRVPRGGVLTAAMVQNSVLVPRNGGERIAASSVRIAPLPEYDERKELVLAAFYVFFPRQKDATKWLLARGNSHVRFECPLAPVSIRWEFDLRKMTREGSPDF
jgi:hypothetical protein